jgi:hypothetical protein
LQAFEITFSGARSTRDSTNLRAQIDISINEYTNKPTSYVDERVTITTIPLFLPSPPTPLPGPSSFARLFKSVAPIKQGTSAEIQEYKKEIVHTLFKGGTLNHQMEYDAFSAQIEEERKLRGDMLWANLPPTEPNNVTLSYFVQNKDTAGKFDIEKAKALNIPKGTLYAKLQAGQDVEFTIVDKEGNEVVKKVQSKDVVGEPKPGRSILIIDLPSVEFVSMVLADEKLNSTVVKNADVVVHMLADDVATDEKYVNWMQSFNKSTKVRNLWVD